MSHEFNNQNILAHAQDFHYGGMEQLDHLAIGEREAKLAILTAMVMGSNVVLVGEPGGAKSTLARSAYRIIDDIEDKNISHIPPLADLSGTRVVGGSNSTTRRIGEVTETTETHIDPILHPNTQVIYADEINRAAPHAINAYLEALEDRKVTSTSGVVNLDKVVYSVATMNPAENKQGVFPVAAATASRHAFGAELGKNEDEADDTAYGIFSGFSPRPELMETVTELAGLKAIRERALHHTAFPDNVKSYGVDAVRQAANVLRDHQIREVRAGRMVVQVRDIAKTLAVLGGKEAVHEDDVRKAVVYMATGRLGMLGAKRGMELSQVIEEIKI